MLFHDSGKPSFLKITGKQSCILILILFLISKIQQIIHRKVNNSVLTDDKKFCASLHTSLREDYSYGS